jgi:hypothetical protein
MRCDVLNAGALTCGSKTFLDVADARTVIVQDVTEIAATTSCPFQVW